MKRGHEIGIRLAGAILIRVMASLLAVIFVAVATIGLHLWALIAFPKPPDGP